MLKPLASHTAGVCAAALGITLGASAPSALAAEPVGQRFSVGVEVGAVGFARNDVRIPGEGGTRFDMTDVVGAGPEPFVRVDGRWRINERQELRVMLAPLEVTASGELDQPTQFGGETFAAGATDGTYRFNAYKFTWRYALADRGRLSWGIGFTGLIRDAEIALRQGDTRASDDNLGFVPALHLSGDYRLGERWSLGLDLDGLAGGPGRLLDASVTLDYAAGTHWRIGGGYRTLEGGADTDDVYNFAWLNYALLEVRYLR